MAASTVTAEGDWAGAPATKGDLMLLRSNLEGKVNNVRGEMAEMGRALSKEIGDVRGEVGDLRGELRTEVSKLRVSMAWMTLGVTTLLGGLITLFQFLS